MARRYRNVVGAVGVVALLLTLIAATTVWQVRWRIAAGPADAPERALANPITSPPDGAETITGSPAASGEPVAVMTATAPPPRRALGSRGPRFAVEFGPFLAGADAERMERQINEAGYQTARFQQQTGAATYAVLIERLASALQAQAVLATLREQGFSDAAVVAGGAGGFAVRVGEPRLLRPAVELAGSLRARGHRVRLAGQPGEVQTFVIRHGNFVSRDDAQARSVELGHLGQPSHVVRTK